MNSEKLVAANPTLLSIYNNLTSLIPLSELINPNLGKIAEVANSVFTKSSDSRQNIIIYMYRDMLLDRFKIQLDIAESRFIKDAENWLLEGLKKAFEQNLNFEEAKKYARKYLDTKKKEKLDR